MPRDGAAGESTERRRFGFREQRGFMANDVEITLCRGGEKVVRKKGFFGKRVSPETDDGSLARFRESSRRPSHTRSLTLDADAFGDETFAHDSPESDESEESKGDADEGVDGVCDGDGDRVSASTGDRSRLRSVSLRVGLSRVDYTRTRQGTLVLKGLNAKQLLQKTRAECLFTLEELRVHSTINYGGCTLLIFLDSTISQPSTSGSLSTISGEHQKRQRRKFQRQVYEVIAKNARQCHVPSS